MLEETSEITQSNLGLIPTLSPAQSTECHLQSFPEHFHGEHSTTITTYMATSL